MVLTTVVILMYRVPELHSNPARKVPFENGPVTEDDDGEGGKASGADDEDDSDDEQLPAMAKTIEYASLMIVV